MELFLPQGTIYPTKVFLPWDFDKILDGMKNPTIFPWGFEIWETIIGKLEQYAYIQVGMAVGSE